MEYHIFDFDSLLIAPSHIPSRCDLASWYNNPTSLQAPRIPSPPSPHLFDELCCQRLHEAAQRKFSIGFVTSRSDIMRPGMDRIIRHLLVGADRGTSYEIFTCPNDEPDIIQFKSRVVKRIARRVYRTHYKVVAYFDQPDLRNGCLTSGEGNVDSFEQAVIVIRPSRRHDPPPWPQPGVILDRSAPPSQRLHEEIVSFLHWLSPTQHEVDLRYSIIAQLRGALIDTHRDPRARATLFGSSCCGLALPWADIDINVSSDWYRTIDALAARVPRNLFQIGFVVRHARVPVIKCVHKESSISVDITLNTFSGPRTTRAMRNLLHDYPVARPLIVLVKYFLRQRNLVEVPKGGISSFSLCCMVVVFLQRRDHTRPMTGYGQLLVEFFTLYGLDLNYAEVALDVSSGAFVPKTPKSINHPFQVIDPTDALNNIASASTSINHIRYAFMDALQRLTADLPEDVDMYPTLLGRILQREQDLANLLLWRQSLKRCRATLSASRNDNIDATPFVPEMNALSKRTYREPNEENEDEQEYGKGRPVKKRR